MRILLIHQFFLEDLEGGGSRWNEMGRIWQQAGHEITVLAGTTHYMGTSRSGYGGKYFSISENGDSIKVIRCFTSMPEGTFLTRLQSYLSFVLSAIWGGMFYAKGKFDIIIVTSPPLFVGVVALILSWVNRVPFVFEVRDLWPESAVETGVLKNKILIRLSFWLESCLLKRAARVVVVTPAFRAHLMQKGVPNDKIIFIPNAADFGLVDSFFPLFDRPDFRRKHDLEGRFVLIYVGAHGIANHLTQLLDAAELLSDTPVLFLLIGDGERKKALVEEAVGRKMGNVRFLDAVPKNEVFQYILASDMGVSVLQKNEIFKTIYSNKTFDYFSCKKPVLMAIDGVSRTLVEEADAGIFVEPENPVDFAQKVRFYIQSPDLLQRQGWNGYQYAKKHFDREELANAYLDFIRHI